MFIFNGNRIWLLPEILGMDLDMDSGSQDQPEGNRINKPLFEVINVMQM